FRVVATTGDITSSSSTEISGDSLDFQAAGDIELAGSFSAGTVPGPEVLTAVSKEGATGPGSVFIQGATVALNGAQIEATGPVYIAATSGDLDALSGSNDISGSALDLRATGSVKLSGSYQAAPIDGSGVLMTPNLDGSSKKKIIYINMQAGVHEAMYCHTSHNLPLAS
ncbi:hypothetical protein, partial [Pseudoxanthomonas broegbernensis]|uniref:hypothetical protein n=1 Tax=Pseudoxanthomonas broegbernensis TaxID=83619 RepID=UPI00139077E9